MAKTTTEHLSHSPMAYLTDLARFEGVTQMWTRPIQLCWRWQADMFKATEPFATGWFERQLDATHLAFETLEKLTRCGDLAEAVAIQRQWFKAATERLTAKFEKLTEPVTSPSREAVLASRDTIPAVAEATTPQRPATQIKTAGQKKARQAKTKTSEAKTESAGEAKVETAGEPKTEAAGEAIDAAGEAKVETAGEPKTEAGGEAIDAVGEAKVGQSETQTAREAKVEAAA